MDVPRLGLEGDQTLVGSVADFFNESMRRDAISGMKMVDALDKRGSVSIISTYPLRGEEKPELTTRERP